MAKDLRSFLELPRDAAQKKESQSSVPLAHRRGLTSPGEPRVFQVRTGFVCGLCGQIHKRLERAFDCLGRCTVQLRLRSPAGPSQFGSQAHFACTACGRGFANCDDAEQCFERCLTRLKPSPDFEAALRQVQVKYAQRLASHGVRQLERIDPLAEHTRMLETLTKEQAALASPNAQTHKKSTVPPAGAEPSETPSSQPDAPTPVTQAALEAPEVKASEPHIEAALEELRIEAAVDESALSMPSESAPELDLNVGNSDPEAASDENEDAKGALSAGNDVTDAIANLDLDDFSAPPEQTIGSTNDTSDFASLAGENEPEAGLGEEVFALNESEAGLGEEVFALNEPEAGLGEEVFALNEPEAGLGEEVFALNEPEAGLGEEVFALNEPEAGLGEEVFALNEPEAGLGEEVFALLQDKPPEFDDTQHKKSKTSESLNVDDNLLDELDENPSDADEFDKVYVRTESMKPYRREYSRFCCSSCSKIFFTKEQVEACFYSHPVQGSDEERLLLEKIAKLKNKSAA